MQHLKVNRFMVSTVNQILKSFEVCRNFLCYKFEYCANNTDNNLINVFVTRVWCHWLTKFSFLNEQLLLCHKIHYTRLTWNCCSDCNCDHNHYKSLYHSVVPQKVILSVEYLKIGRKWPFTWCIIYLHCLAKGNKMFVQIFRLGYVWPKKSVKKSVYAWFSN